MLTVAIWVLVYLHILEALCALGDRVLARKELFLGLVDTVWDWVEKPKCILMNWQWSRTLEREADRRQRELSLQTPHPLSRPSPRPSLASSLGRP